MIKIKDNTTGNDTFPMYNMKPYDICEIVGPDYGGEIVMMVGDEKLCIVASLSRPTTKGSCWTKVSSLPVRRLPKGTTITLEVV